MPFLSRRALEGLKAYKYKPGGYTIMDRIHNPFWNWLTEQLPMWLAPNLITLSGLVLMFVAYLVNAYYLPDYTGEAPPWTFMLAGISIIVYTNLDCIDGKQARRTKSSSPLGQLFDHGCDALSLHIMLAMAQSCMAHKSDVLSALIIQWVNLPWIVSHWEEYHTGVLMYSDGYFGVLEANYTLAGIMLLTGWLGPGMWHTPLTALLPTGRLPSALQARLAGWDLRLEHSFLLFTVALGVTQLLGQLLRVFRSHPKEGLPEDERGNKALGVRARLMHLGYIAGLLGLGMIILSHGGLHPYQARLESLAYGTVYAYVATQLIMDHMSKEPFTPPLPIVIVSLAFAANCIWHLVPGHLAAYVLTPVIVAMYLQYVLGVISEVCAFLGIKCLTIKSHSG